MIFVDFFRKFQETIDKHLDPCTKFISLYRSYKMGCTHSLALIKRNPSIINQSTQKDELNCKLSGHEIRLVNKTWKILSTDMTGYGSKVFLRIFQINPKVKQLFPCRNVEGEELLKDPNFKGHASRFMQAIGAAVDNINCLDQQLAPLLLELGKRHVNFAGFEEEYFEAFVEGVMYVLSQELQRKFDDEAKTAWKTIFDFIMLNLKAGYRIEKSNIEKQKHNS